MIKGVVFDMDGLMFDTELLAVTGWEYAGRQTGYVINQALVAKTFGLNVESTRRLFLEHFGSDFDYYGVRQVRLKYATAYLEKNGIPVKKGLIELLEFLKLNGYKRTVATSTDEEKTRSYLKMAGVSPYFDEIVCGDMVERSKPEPDIYLKAAGVIGLASAECIALEDSPIGILSAYRAGLKPVMIPDMVEPDEETRGRLYARLPSLLEVIGILKH